jgi:hypothetical protein
MGGVDYWAFIAPAGRHVCEANLTPGGMSAHVREPLAKNRWSQLLASAADSQQTSVIQFWWPKSVIQFS